MPPGTRPHTASAQRGTNVAVSKRTRFALQVQKPTGEEGTEGGSKESTVSGMDLGVSPSTANPGGGLRSPRGGGRGARRSRSPTARGGRGAGREGGLDGTQPQDGMGRAGRGGGRGRTQAGKGAPSLSTDDDTLVNTLQRDYIQRGKSRWVGNYYIHLKTNSLDHLGPIGCLSS